MGMDPFLELYVILFYWGIWPTIGRNEGLRYLSGIAANNSFSAKAQQKILNQSPKMCNVKRQTIFRLFSIKLWKTAQKQKKVLSVGLIKWGLGRLPGERLGKEPHKCPKVLSECQASADLRNVDQEGIYLAVYTIIHLKFCQKDVNTEGYELDT